VTAKLPPSVDLPSLFGGAHGSVPQAWKANAFFGTSREVFQWALATCQTKSEVFRAYVGDASVRAPDLPPRPGDETLETYGARLAERFGSRFGVVVNNLQKGSFAAWRRVRSFLAPVYEKIGFRSVEIALFLGTYERTAFGVHKDVRDIFVFIVRGSKRFRLWHEGTTNGAGDTIESLTFRTDYESFLDSSTVMEGGPGDILFWPKRYFHVGESSGSEVVASLSLGLQGDVTSLDLARFRNEIAELHARRMPVARHAVSIDLRRDGRVADDAARSSVRRAIARRPTPKQLTRAAVVAHLERISGYGSTDVPDAVAWERLLDADVVRIEEGFPVPSIAHGRALFVGGNGTVVEVPYGRNVAAVVERLNAGHRVRLRDVGGSVRDRDIARELLERLLVRGAVRRVER
jgi:50S ribosomal protein L16 3-hydroxylase